jgi:hypothetical protein
MKTIIGIAITIMLVLFIAPRAYCSDTEQLLGLSFNFDKKEVNITVVTSGCTEKDDFQFVMKTGDLTIVRKKKDTCKMMESAATFTYTLKEAGIDPNKPFRVKNEFIANVFVANIR